MIRILVEKGAFGEVRMCVHRESGAQRAVKVLRKSHMDDDEKRMLFNEINILKEIVSKIVGVVERALYFVSYANISHGNFTTNSFNQFCAWENIGPPQYYQNVRVL